ncbi:hypothetical protein CFC21_048960 [Triticum aestivum]|nr:hypothetical protein CFC21_048960 [Triticum aestivum]
MLPENRRSVHYVGPALLSRAHPSRLCFEVVCLAIEAGHLRAWVASFKDGKCVWRALPQAMEVKTDFNDRCIEGRSVHAAGNIYWHICNSGRLLVLDPATMQFSYLSVPSELGDHFFKFRIGEMPEDGRLCIGTVENEEMQLSVRGGDKCSDNGWLLEWKLNLCEVYDMVPGLPRDTTNRILGVWLSDIDAGRTGKLFIKTWGYGRYAFSLETRKLERLTMEGGKEYGHPIYAYVLAWPPAFLAQDC